MTARFLFLIVFAFASLVIGDRECQGKLASGQPAPSFSLSDVDNKPHDLSQSNQRPMIILYFFDPESKPSLDGLLSLNELAGQYKGADLAVWAITLAPKEKLTKALASTKLIFPILLDNSGVSGLYSAKAILPTVCIIGPGLKVLDHLQGGGKTTEIMLVKLAEREMQRKKTQIAMDIGDKVVKKNPKNIEAKTVMAHAALKSGKVDAAKQAFQELSQKGGQAEVLGMEGLAAVHVRQGEPEKALKLAADVERKAPGRSYPNVIKGDVLYSQNKVAEAKAEYQKAVGKNEAEPYQKAVAYNQLGRLYAKSGENEAARKFYDQAVAIDPYYIEGTTNKALTYEKEGKWDAALDSYRQAMSVEKNDTFAAVMAKKAQEMLDIQKDAQRKERIDRLVKDLAERYRSQQKTASKDEDTWTSRPMILSFVDFQEKGGLVERDGYATVFTLQLSDYLNASSRLQVVERALMERLLEELNLGSSELADPETALKLGKVLAAKLIGTGTLMHLPNGTLMSFRLVDTETSSIAMVVNKDLGPQWSTEGELNQINRDILKTVISKYPLRGYVVKPADDRVMINLGSKHGVVTGTKFDVLQEQEAVEYKGKKLQASAKSVGVIEVTQVEPDFSYARIVTRERPPKKDDKIQEKLETTAAVGGKSDV